MNEKELIYGLAFVQSEYTQAARSIDYIICTEQAAELLTTEQRIVLVQAYSILSSTSGNLTFKIDKLLKGE